MTPIKETGSTQPEDVDRKPLSVGVGPSGGTSAPLPAFLQEGVRHREAYLQLIKDLNVTLSEEWQSQPEVRIREKISAAIADSLRIWI